MAGAMAERIVRTAKGPGLRGRGCMLLSVLLCGSSPAALAATPACFAQPRDGSGVGDLHLLTADPLDVSRLATLNVKRASSFFRDRDLAGITVELLEGGAETTLTFTFTGTADYEMLINRAVHVGEATANPRHARLPHPLSLLRARRTIADRTAARPVRAPGGT